MEKSTESDAFSEATHVPPIKFVEEQGQHHQTLSLTSEKSSVNSDSSSVFPSCSGQLVCHDNQYGITALNTSLASHVKGTSTFASTGLIESSSFDSLSGQKNSNQTMTQNVILGNIAAANLLPSTISVKQCTYTSSSHNLCGQVLNVVSLPVFLQGADNMPHVSGVSCPSSSGALTSLIPSFDISSQSQNLTCNSKRKKSEHEEEQNLLGEPPAKMVSYNSDKFSRSSLLSADTVIITSASLNSSDTLPVSSLPHSSVDRFVNKTSVKEVLSLPSEKAFSLISNISDKSVSLESIPTMSLFKPDPDESIDSGAGTSGTTKSESSTSDKIAIVGDDKIPQSIILFLKQKRGCNIQLPQEKNTVSNQTSNNCLPTIEDGNEVASEKTDQDNEKNKSKQYGGDSDTDTEVQDEEKTVSEHRRQGKPSRSDTLLLDMSKDGATLTSKPAFSASDTVILQEELDTLPSDKSSGGFSINSATSTETPALIVETDEGPVSRLPTSQENSDQLPIIQTSYPLGLIVSETPNKSFYTVTSNGQLSAVRYIGSDQLDLSVLAQLGLLNNTITNTPSQNEILSQCSLSLAGSSSSANRIAQAKETQTDLVLGTRAVYFKLGDSLCSTVDQFPPTILAEPLSEQSSSTQSSGETAGNSVQQNNINIRGAEIEKFHENVISLESSSNPPSSLQSLNADTQCGTTSPETSNSELPHVPPLVMLSPSTLPEGETLEFKCKECQEGFRSKQELNTHEKTHKKSFKCDLCNATFTRMGNYTRHRKIHNLQPESQHLFKCNKCEREFLQRCDLKRHLLIHSNQEPHRCEKCGKGYIRHSDLVVHMRFHNKDKAFKCNMCDKRFFQTGDLSRHVRRSHKPVSLLTCGHCERKYACETTLIRHMKAVHKDIILNTVNQRLQESDQGNRSPSVNTKDVLFTMTQKSVDVQQ